MAEEKNAKRSDEKPKRARHEGGDSGYDERNRDRGRGRDRDRDYEPEKEVVEERVITIPAFSAAAFEARYKYGYVWGTGRRKSSVARVRVRSGEGKFLINDRDVEDYFRVERDRKAVITPLDTTQTRKNLDVFVKVHGGGTTGQAGAIVLGLARALRTANKEYEPLLRDKGLLTRDARKVERKKYGQPGARRRFQFSKR